jgi:hypothetical protein
MSHEPQATKLEVSFHEAGVDFVLDEEVVGEDVQTGGYGGLDGLDDKFL